MTDRAVYVRLEAKPGKEAEVEAFLKEARSLVMEERRTAVWFALRIGPSSFAIFDAFDGEAAREAHLQGKVAEALKARAAELFANQLHIVPVEVIADKLPG
jgi:quinol monooxygenase YgiN